MKKYLIYLIKTKWLQTLILAVIPTLVFFSILLMSYNPQYTSSPYYPPNEFVFSLFFIMIIVIIVTVFRLSIFRNSKDVDLYYSLPISRQNLLVTQLLFGLLQIIFVWTFMYMIGLISLTILTNGFFTTSPLLLAYLIVIGYIIIIYSITSFLFLRANTILDGITFIVIFNTAFIFISAFFTHRYFRVSLNFTESSMFSPYYALNEIMSHLIYFSKPNPMSSTAGLYGQNIGATIINTVLFSILSILCFLYSYNQILKEKTEHIGRLSTSKFGYFTLIPLNLLFSTASVYFGLSSFSIVAISILASAGLIGFFIMRRSARLKWIDLFLIVAPIMLGILIMSIVQA